MCLNLTEGYIVLALIDATVLLERVISICCSFCFRSDAWAMVFLE